MQRAGTTLNLTFSVPADAKNDDFDLNDAGRALRRATAAHPIWRQGHAHHMGTLTRWGAKDFREAAHVGDLTGLGQLASPTGELRDHAVLEGAQLVEIDRRLAELDPPRLRVTRFVNEVGDGFLLSRKAEG